MPIFKKPDETTPDSPPAELSFASTKKGWDPDEVKQYVDGLLDQHEEDLGAVVGKLRAEQQDKQQFTQAMEQQIQTLEEARDHAIARAEEFEQVLKQAQAESDTVAHERVAELEAQLAAASQSNVDPEILTELHNKLAEAEAYVQQTEAVYDERDRLLHELETLGTGDQHEARIRAEEQVRVLEEQLHMLRSEADNPLLQEASAQAVATLQEEVDNARAQADEARAQAESLQQQVTHLQEELEHNATQHSELQRHVESVESQLQARTQEVEQSQAHVEEATRLHHEALRQAAAAEAETDHLQREVARLREENPSISDTARRMQAALEELQRKHETEMAAVMQAAQQDADELRAAASREAAALTQATIADLERSVTMYQQQLEQAQIENATALQERGTALESLHEQMSSLLDSTRSTYADSFQFLQAQYEREHSALAHTRTELLSEIESLQHRRDELINHLTRVTEAAGPVAHEDLVSDEAAEPVAPHDAAEDVHQPIFDPFAGNNHEEPVSFDSNETVTDPFEVNAFDIIDEESTNVEPSTPVVDETEYAPNFVLNDEAPVVESTDEDHHDDIDIDLEQPITLGTPRPVVVEEEDEVVEEIQHTPPSSDDVWAGFSEPEAVVEPTIDVEVDEPVVLPEPAPEPPAFDDDDYVTLPEEDVNEDETTDRPSVSDLANMTAPDGEREDEADHHAEKTDQPAPRIFTEDD